MNTDHRGIYICITVRPAGHRPAVHLFIEKYLLIISYLRLDCYTSRPSAFLLWNSYFGLKETVKKKKKSTEIRKKCKKVLNIMQRIKIGFVTKNDWVCNLDFHGIPL